MKKILLSFIIYNLALNISFAQEQLAYHWYFGYYAGIDFSSGTAVVDYGQMITDEGCCAISDKSGNLLFYSKVL